MLLNIPDWLAGTKRIDSVNCKSAYGEELGKKLELNKFLNWQEIRKDLKKHNVKNMLQYRKNRKGNWPSNPDKYYKKYWKGSRHFFTGVIFPEWDVFCKQVRKEKIKFISEYNRKIRKNWPRCPNEVYKEWKNWHHLFHGKDKDDWLDFSELHKQVLKMNFKSYKEYRKHRKPNWPSHPITVYKEFNGWPHFLQGKTAEQISNEICMQLCNFIKKNKRTPSRYKKEEKYLISYLERRRNGTNKILDSDLKIAKKMGFPNLFKNRDLEKESNQICLELCNFIKKNKRLPSAKSKDKKERSLKSWMWSRLTCQDKKWKKRIFKSDVQILKKEKLYDFVFKGN